MTSMTNPIMSPNKQLLQQQLEGVAVKRKAKPVQASAATGVSYNARLRAIVKEIKKDVDTILMPLLRKLSPQYETDSAPVFDAYTDEIFTAINRIVNKWRSPEFSEVANKLSSEFINTADKVNRKRFNTSMKSVGLDVFGDSPELVSYIDTSIFDNTRLIKSIPEQYLSNVQSIVMTNVRAGGRPSSIASSLLDQFDVTNNRAKMIARDQTAKVNGDLSAKRQQNVGFEYFQWLDSDDQRVRRRHEGIADKVTAYGKGIYRWDNPPLSDKGIPIIPGQDFQCRCVAVPVSNAQVEANQKSGAVNKGVKK